MIQLNTINKAILKKAEFWSDRIALQLLFSGKLHNYTYGVLLQKIKAGTEQIKKTGIKTGDRLVLIAENCPEWVIAYLAALEANTTVVLLDPTLPIRELSQLIQKSDPRLFILSPRIREKLPSEVTLGNSDGANP